MTSTSTRSAPGPDTEMSRANVPAERREEFTRGTPADRCGTPDEPVGAVVFLASAASSYVTDTALSVDGGYLISPR
jgi:2-dehydro-3-deoxy-D-gluconate 5-dehydrogenase